MNHNPTTNREERIQLSVVVTAFNSAETIAVFLHRMSSAVKSFPQVSLHQLIVVDDCSNDETLEVVSSLGEFIPELRVVRLSRNRGQQIAASAGVLLSTGEFTLLIDDDGQNPIEEIPALISQCLEPDVDVVIATSEHRRLSRRITSKLFWSVMRGSRLTREPENQLMMRLLSRRVVDAFKGYPESTRTIYGIVRDIGFGVVGHPVKVDSHISGREVSKYSFIDRFEVFIDTYLTDTNRPFAFLLRMSMTFGFVGGSVAAVSFLLFATYRNTQSFLVLLLGSFFLIVSVAVFFLAVLLRLLQLVFIEVRRRPLFHVAVDQNFSSRANRLDL